jgi:predicted ATPase
MPTIVPADSDRFFVITGGPGAGKTTLLEALRAHGYAIAPESARAILRERSALGVDGHRDHLLFAELCLHWDIRNYRDAQATAGPVFFDQAAAGWAGYLRTRGVPVPPHFDVVASRFRYARTVFAAPPWREIFHTDAERTQTWDHACRAFEEVTHAYRRLGYDLVERPKASVPERVAFVRARI